MEIIRVTKKKNMQKAITRAVEVLRSGGIVIYPTETSYGIGVDATSRKAVKRMLEYKERPRGKAISIAVNSKKMAESYVEINKNANNIYNALLPGPITVISKSKHKVAKGIESEDGKLGIRYPNHEIPLEIIKKLGKPITSTSANVSTKKTPYKIDDIFEQISIKKKKYIDLILDFGELPHNPTSTVVDTTLQDVNIIREGPIKFPQILQEYISISENNTFKIATRLIESINTFMREYCIIFLLNGELGVGKTRMTKGFAKALNISATIKSPTFTIISEYDIPSKKFFGSDKQLIHIDIWRLASVSELDKLDVVRYVRPGNIIAIEWADKFIDFFINLAKGKKVKIFNINFEYISTNKRRIVVSTR